MGNYNIRVYGILINESDQVLVVDECRNNFSFTKFPGGGLQWGEGLVDCLRRECFEEMKQEVEVVRHLYTTDYFQPSVFNKQDQLISVYYQIALKGPVQFNVEEGVYEAGDTEVEQLCFRWVNRMDNSLMSQLTFPVDQLVAKEYLTKM